MADRKAAWLRVTEGDTYQVHQSRDGATTRFTCLLCYSISLDASDSTNLFCPHCKTHHRPGFWPKEAPKP